MLKSSVQTLLAAALTSALAFAFPAPLAAAETPAPSAGPEPDNRPVFKVVPPEAKADSVHPIDTLSDGWAAREDSLRMAADSAASKTAAADTGGEAGGPVLPGTSEGRGSLSGRVVSEMTGTVVSKARVILAGQEKSAETDADGNFGFPDLTPGSYSVLITHPGYDPLSADSLPVSADRGTVRRLRMPDKVSQRDRVRITFKAGKASDAGLLFAQKNAPAVSDGISTEQISKSPDGDAAAAIKRVSGISIAGDGLVYVRGLGERYVNVQLNGISLSSPNPEKRVIPLDVFPTRLIENLVVSKTFTADQPAEFAGGSIQLRTRSIPDRLIKEVSVSGGYDPGATFGTMYTAPGGDYDWLGLEDGSRDLPSDLPDASFDFRSASLGKTPQERQARQKEMLASFRNVWTPGTAKAPLNQSYGLTLGNRIPMREDWTAGWLLGVSYGGKWEVDEEFVGGIKIGADGKASYSQRFESGISAQSVLSGILANVGFKNRETASYRLTVLANRSFQDEVTRIEGQNESDADSSLTFGLENTRQDLLNGQIEAENRFGEEGTWKLNWIGAISRAERHQPDRSIAKYLVMRPGDDNYNPDFPYRADVRGSYVDRYWFDSREGGLGGKVDLEAPLALPFLGDASRARTGGSWFRKDRRFGVSQFTFFPGSSAATEGRTYEEVIADYNGANDSGYVTNRNDMEKNDYGVDAHEFALHAQADLEWTDWLRTVAGLRFNAVSVDGAAESDRANLSSQERSVARCDTGGRCEIPFGFDDAGLLPSASAVFSPSERQNLRFSFARTFAFPEYREMAPLLYYDYQERVEVEGNIALKPTSILNYDVRYEIYPSPAEMLAVSGFYKTFSDPVEALIQYGASNNRVKFANIPSAWLYGFEAEARLVFSRLHSSLEPFKAVVNYTWIESEVEGKVKRAMQGQSPYLVNAILFFEPFDGAMQTSLLYNRIGRRISKVGVESFPDVYEEAREILEFAWSQKVTRGLKLKFTAKNILDAEVRRTQGGLTTRAFRPGRSFSLGASYAF